MLGYVAASRVSIYNRICAHICLYVRIVHPSFILNACASLYAKHLYYSRIYSVCICVCMTIKPAHSRSHATCKRRARIYIFHIAALHVPVRSSIYICACQRWESALGQSMRLHHDAEKGIYRKDNAFCKEYKRKKTSYSWWCDRWRYLNPGKFAYIVYIVSRYQIHW